MLLIATVALAAYTSLQAIDHSQDINNQTKPSNSPAPTPKPSSTPNQTASPQATTTTPPQITPAPTSRLPDDCRINYQETARDYHEGTNTTEITLYLEILPDFSTRNTYLLYSNNFYLEENDMAISTPNANATNEEIILNENYKQTTTLTLQVPGHYTSSNYELAYLNPPPILLIWKKL
jgi:hypothetical protein